MGADPSHWFEPRRPALIRPLIRVTPHKIAQFIALLCSHHESDICGVGDSCWSYARVRIRFHSGRRSAASLHALRLAADPREGDITVDSVRVTTMGAATVPLVSPATRYVSPRSSGQRGTIEFDY